MRMKGLFAAVVAGGLLVGGAAQAQIKAEHPRFCVMSVGPTQMMFSAFQENKTDEIFCQNVPEAGRTMIILDARQPELRDLAIEVWLLRDVGQKDWRDNLDSTMIAHLEPRKYLAQNGTTTLTHDFDKDGDYMAVVRATSEDGAKDYSGLYRFSVGESILWYVVMGAIAMVAVVAFAGLLRSRSRRSADPAVRRNPVGSTLR